jgi:predicted metal-dependent hydrolase
MEPVEIRRSQRARRWRLVAPWGEPARLTAPRRMTRAEIAEVVEAYQPWIAEQRRRQVPRLELPRLSEREGRARTRALVTEIAEQEAPRIGVRYDRIRIAGQRTRWGSCSTRGTLSFNWRLALAPIEVADYVVVHELCHLREANHSRAFWSLVEHHRPGYLEQRTWLRRHGSELLAYGMPAAPNSFSLV